MANEHRRGCDAAGFHLMFASILLISTLVPAGVAAQSAPPAAAVSTADRLLSASRAAFEGLGESERKQIQDDLVWTSTYRGMIDGGFGRGTFAAASSFELTAKLTADGILDASERVLLAKAADTAKRAIDWRILEEPASGARIGYPAKLLPTQKKMPDGVLFGDAAGSLALNVERVRSDPGGLAALFERLKSEQPGRKVTYAVQKPEWFVIAAEAGGRRSYSRFAATPAGPVGFTFAYDATVSDGERLAVAIANAFEPVATAAVEAGAPKPVSVAPIRPDPNLAAPTGFSGVVVAPKPSVATPAVAAASGASSGLVGASALVVAAGRAITVQRVATACRAPSVAGKPVRVLASSGGAVLIDVDGVVAPTERLGVAAASDGEVVALLQAASTTKPVLTAATGTVVAAARGVKVVIGAPKGIAGAAVFDRGGAFVGLIAGPETEPRAIGGIAPEMALALVSAADLTALLAGQGLGTAMNPGTPGGTARTVGELTRGHGKAVIAITCGL